MQDMKEILYSLQDNFIILVCIALVGFVAGGTMAILERIEDSQVQSVKSPIRSLTHTKKLIVTVSAQPKVIQTVRPVAPNNTHQPYPSNKHYTGMPSPRKSSHLNSPYPSRSGVKHSGNTDEPNVIISTKKADTYPTKKIEPTHTPKPTPGPTHTPAPDNTADEEQNEYPGTPVDQNDTPKENIDGPISDPSNGG